MSKKNKTDETVLAKVDPQTVFDRIQGWYLKGESYFALTPVELKQKQRWEECFSMLCNYKSPEEVSKLMMKKFKISKATFYRDLKYTMKLFGDITKSSKEADRYLLYQYSMHVYQKARNKKPSDIDGMNKAIANMIKLKGLEKDDPDMPDFTKLEQNIYNINIAPELKELFLNMVKLGAVNLADLTKQTIQLPAQDPGDGR